MIHELREDLRTASELVRSLGEKTFGQVLLLQDRVVVELAEVIPPLIFALRERFAPLVIHDNLSHAGAIRLVGGRPAFERLLLNLVENAAQGDGRRHASQVWVRDQLQPARWLLEIADDGPGFPSSVLGALASGCLSTKASGSGLGIHGIAQLVQASGGAIRLSHRAEGGALVQIELHRRE
jgi:C4-dicarboxylate-specific signal transduction histidine kinase